MDGLWSVFPNVSSGPVGAAGGWAYAGAMVAIPSARVVADIPSRQPLRDVRVAFIGDVSDAIRNEVADAGASIIDKVESAAFVVCGDLASDGSMVSKSLQEFSSLDFSGLERAVNGAQALADLVPPETLKHRVENWLDGGCSKTNERLWRLRRTGRSSKFLVICGEDDRFLPSKDEAQRLKKALDAESITLRGGGHAVLVRVARASLFRQLEALGIAPRDGHEEESSELDDPQTPTGS